MLSRSPLQAAELIIISGVSCGPGLAGRHSLVNTPRERPPGIPAAPTRHRGSPAPKGSRGRELSKAYGENPALVRALPNTSLFLKASKRRRSGLRDAGGGERRTVPSPNPAGPPEAAPVAQEPGKPQILLANPKPYKQLAERVGETSWPRGPGNSSPPPRLTAPALLDYP